MKSSLYLIDKEKESPLKSLISKSYIMDINPEMCLRMRENLPIQNHLFIDEDDNLSIEDQIERERNVLQNRMEGFSIVKTNNFLEDFEFWY